MTPFQEATSCLLGWPLRGAGIFWQGCVHLGAFVAYMALAAFFLAAFVLFPITLPLLYWMIIKAEKLDAISRADAERKLDEHYGHLRRKVKRRTNWENLDCLVSREKNPDSAFKNDTESS